MENSKPKSNKWMIAFFLLLAVIVLYLLFTYGDQLTSRSTTSQSPSSYQPSSTIYYAYIDATNFPKSGQTASSIPVFSNPCLSTEKVVGWVPHKAYIAIVEERHCGGSLYMTRISHSTVSGWIDMDLTSSTPQEVVGKLILISHKR